LLYHTKGGVTDDRKRKGTALAKNKICRQGMAWTAGERGLNISGTQWAEGGIDSKGNNLYRRGEKK